MRFDWRSWLPWRRLQKAQKTNLMPVSGPGPLTPWWTPLSVTPGSLVPWMTVGQAHFAVEQQATILALHVVAPLGTRHESFTLQDAGHGGVGEKNVKLVGLPSLSSVPLYTLLERPFHILPQQNVHLFVASPLCIQVFLSDADCLLLEVASERFRNTFRGEGYTEGQLCYSAAMACEPDLSSAAFQSNAVAITPLFVQNRSRSILKLDQIYLPTPYLSIYTDSEHRLWTEQLNITQTADLLPEIKIAAGVPHAELSFGLLTSPRLEDPNNPSLKSLMRFLVRQTS